MIWRITAISVVSVATTSLSSFFGMQAVDTPNYITGSLLNKSFCGEYTISTPSAQEREFYSSQYRFSFKIPQNFRVASVADNTFIIVSEEGLSDYQCAARKPSCPPDNLADCHRIAMRMHHLTSSDQQRSIEELVTSMGAGGASPQRIGTVNSLFIFKHSSPSGGHSFVSFVSPERKILVTISYWEDDNDVESTPYEAMIVNRMIQTFQFK